MKIATYNVNGINGRLPVLLQWLHEANPDIVCLQELKAPQERFPVKEINEAAYQAIWKGQKSWNGVAILTKDLEIVEVQQSLSGLVNCYLRLLFSNRTNLFAKRFHREYKFSEHDIQC